jgi:hypothetical protein
MSPAYAPPFHDLSETGPGVRSATLKGFTAEVLERDSFPEQAPNVIAKSTTTAVEKRLKRFI